MFVDGVVLSFPIGVSAATEIDPMYGASGKNDSGRCRLLAGSCSNFRMLLEKRAVLSSAGDATHFSSTVRNWLLDVESVRNCGSDTVPAGRS